jgi:hypothetical protein
MTSHLAVPRIVGLSLLAMASLVSTAYAGSVPGGGVYAGESQTPNGDQPRYPLSLRLSRTGGHIASLLIFHQSQPCASSGESLRGGSVVRGARVRRGGSFADTDSFRSVAGDGRTLQHSNSIRGRVGSRVAQGVYQEVITVLDASGNAVDTCDTGPMPFSARRGSRTYGGTARSSSPEDRGGYPLGLYLSRDRTRVSSLSIMWRANCGSAGALDRAIEHSAIRIRDDGRISRSGRLAFTRPNGATWSGKFTLSGRVGDRRASGTYRASVTRTTPSGVTFKCDTGNIRWSASRGP